MSTLTVAVVGAGAAGLVAAAFAAAAGARVTLIERTKDGGRKILISGGGRCNVLPSVATPERFVTDSPPHLLRAHAAIVAAARTARLLRRRPRHSAGARRGIRQAVSAIQSRPRRARRAGDVRRRQGRGRCSSAPRSPTCRARPVGLRSRHQAESSSAIAWCWPPAGCRCRRPAATASGSASRKRSGTT